MVNSTNDDEVFKPSADEQIIIVQKTQIAGAQERTFAGIRKTRVKDAMCFFRTIPVALGHAWSLYPDLSCLVWQASRQRLRLHNHDSLLSQSAATTRDLACCTITTLDRLVNRQCRRFGSRYDK